MLKTIGKYSKFFFTLKVLNFSSQPNLLTKSNKKSMCVSIDNNVSSRKNSRNSYDSKFHSSPTRAHSNNTQKNNYSNKSSDKETKELIPKKVI